MSTNVENQVVRLRLENDQYERAVSQSIKSAERLEKSLNMKGAGKGLEEFDRNVERLNPTMERVGRSIENFSVKAIAKFQIVSRYIDGMISRFEGFLKSVTIEPRSLGWTKYAEETQSVQTIMAATGKTIGEVSEQLERLSWFTDETSYNLTDMTNNIGKFTSNGVALNKSVTAMEGIAAAAGLAGAGTQNASHAMTGFSKAIAQGKMDRQTWSWIETANMATKQFKEAAIEAGIAVGTLIEKNGRYYTTAKKASEVSYQVFEQTLTDGWMTTDVIMKTLDKFGGFTDQLYLATEKTGLTATNMLTAIEKYQAGTLDMAEFAAETSMEVGELDEMMKLLSSDTYEVGRKSLRAAQEAKTFQEAIDSVKDAVSTKWKDTWKYIFGDYEEARKLWTTVANELYDAFAAGGDARNEMLDEWKEMGGRTEGLKAVINLYSTLKSVLSSVKSGFEAVFPMMTGSKLYSMTKRFADFTSKVGLTEKQMNQLQRVSKGVFSVFDALFSVVGKVAKSLWNLVDGVLDELDIDLLEVAAKAGDMLYSFSQVVKESPIIEDSISAIGGALKFAAGFVSVLVEQFFELSRSEGTAGAAIRFLTTGFNEILGFGEKVVEIVKDIISELGELDEITLEDVKNAVRSFFSSIGELSVSGVFSGTKQAFFKMIDSIVNKVSTFIGKFPELKEAVVTLFSFIKNFFDTFDFGSLMVIGLSASMMKFMALLGKFVDGIIKTLSSMTEVTNTIVEILKGVEKAIGGVTNLLNAFSKSILRTANSRAMINYAIAIGILSASLIALSFVPIEKLWPVVLTLGAFSLVMLTAIGVFANSMNKLKGLKVPALIGSLSALSIAIAILGGVFASLGKMDFKQWAVATLGLASIVAALGALVLAVTKASPAVILASVNFIAMAAGVYAMTFAFKSLAKLNADEIAAGIIGLIGVVAAIAQLSKHVKVAIQWKDYTGLIAIAISLSLFAIGLKGLAQIKPEQIIKSVLSLIAVIAVVTTFLIAAKNAGEHTAKAGVAVLAMTAALVLMGTAIKKLSKITAKELLNATASVSAMIVVFGLFVALTKLAGQYSGKAAWAILAASIGLTILSAAMIGLSVIRKDKLENATVALGLIMGMLAVIVAATGKSKDAKITLTAIGAVMTTLALILGSMTLLTPEKAKQGTAVVVAIGAVLAGILGMSHFMKEVDWTIILLAAAMAGLAGLVYLLSNINADQALKNSTSLAILATTMTGAVTILSAIPTTAILLGLKNLLLITGVFTAALGIMGGIIAGIDALTGGGATKAFETIGEAIGGMIGAFFGGIIAAFNEVATSNIEEVGRRLSGFMENLEPFFEKAKGFASLTDDNGTETGLKKAQDIVHMISELVDAALYFPEQDKIDGMSASLANFGTAMVSYSDVISKFNASAVESSDKAVGMILDLVQKFPREGVLHDFLHGSIVDMNEFGPQLVNFAKWMWGYSNWMVLFDEDAVEKSSKAVSAVLAISEKWPRSNAFIDFFSGTVDMDTFGNQLVSFGKWMWGYSNWMALFNEEAVTSSVSAIEAVLVLANNAPKFGGLDWFLSGDIDMNKLGDQLCKFAKRMVEYSEIISGNTEAGTFNADTVSKTTEVIQALLVLSEFLPHVSSGIDKIFGGKDMTFADFGKDLSELGRTLASYSTYIANLDTVKMKSVSAAVLELIHVLDSLRNFESYGVSEFCVAIGDMIDSGLSLGLQESTGAEEQARMKGEDVIAALAEGAGCASPSVKAHQIGIWTIEGLVIGLKDGADQFNLTGVASNACLAVIKAMNTALGVASPSKKTRSSGEDTVRGLILGMEANERRAVATAERIASNVVGAFQNQTAVSVSSIVGDLTSAIFGKTVGSSTYKMRVKKETKNFFGDIGSSFNDGRDELFKSIGVEDAVSQATEAMEGAIPDFGDIGAAAGSNFSSGAGSGIKENKSPEEAAKEKAEKISEIFDAEISRLGTRISIRGKEFDVWELMEGKDLSETEKAEVKLKKLLADAVDGQGQVEAAMERHAQISKELGQGSEQEIEAYGQLLDQQKSLATLINEIQETHKSLNAATTSTMRSQRDAAQAYFDYMKEYKSQLMAMGLTLEEVQSLAQKESGWKGLNVQNETDELSKQVQQVVESATKTVQGVYRDTAERELGAQLSEDFRRYGAQNATAMGQGIEEKTPEIATKVEALGQMAADTVSRQNETMITVGVQFVDFFIEGIQSKIDQAAEAAAAMARAAYAAVMAEFAMESDSYAMGPVPVTVSTTGSGGGGGGGGGGVYKPSDNGMVKFWTGNSYISIPKTSNLASSINTSTSPNGAIASSTSETIINNNYSFNQTNNSPKPLSTSEIARQSKLGTGKFAAAVAGTK